MVRVDREETKIRPVFDASCSTAGQVSLNNCLYEGPVLLGKIQSLLISFRLRKFGLVGDTVKAFRMSLIIGTETRRAYYGSKKGLSQKQ